MNSIRVTDDHCVLKWNAIVGESPLWHAGEKVLYWVDIQRQRVHRFDPATKQNETFNLPEIVTCLAFTTFGELLVTLRKRIAFFNCKTGALRTLHEVEADQPENRFNDGRVDPQGRFWCGTMGDKDWDKPLGKLYRVDADHSLHAMRDQVICANGTAWSPDGRTMYFTESFRYTIWAYEFDPATGGIANPRPFATLDPAAKVFPDGLCVDADGGVWSNHVGQGRVVRYDPAGQIERELIFPVPRAVGCSFGGADLSTLYVTSARETMTAKQLKAAPLSGSVFAIDVGVRGLPATPFAG